MDEVTAAAAATPLPGSTWEQYALILLLVLMGVLIYFVRQHSAERVEWKNEHVRLAERQEATAIRLAERQDQTAKEITDKFVALHQQTLELIAKQ